MSGDITTIVFSQDSTAVKSDIKDAILLLDGVILARGSFDGKELTFFDLELTIENFRHLALFITPSDEAVAGHALSLELTDVGTVAGVSFSGESVVAYISEAPIVPVIDGLFDEWTEPEVDEVGDVSNPNVDISAYDAKGYLEETYFYLQVEGNILYGNAVPSNKAMNIPSEGGAGDSASSEPSSSGTQEENPLPVETGEDAIYIFLDTVPGQGYNSKNLLLSADFMIEIIGQDGNIYSSKYYKFDGETSEEWKWKFVKTVEAASGLKEIETLVDALPLNTYFHLVDWEEYDDWSDNSIYYEPDVPKVDGTRGDPTWPSSWTQIINDPDDISNNCIDIDYVYWAYDATHVFFRVTTLDTFDPATDTIGIVLNDLSVGSIFQLAISTYYEATTGKAKGYYWVDETDPTYDHWATEMAASANHIKYNGNMDTGLYGGQLAFDRNEMTEHYTDFDPEFGGTGGWVKIVTSDFMQSPSTINKFEDNGEDRDFGSPDWYYQNNPGNNVDDVAGSYKIPEFNTILLPTTGILAMFAIIRKKKLLNEK